MKQINVDLVFALLLSSLLHFLFVSFHLQVMIQLSSLLLPLSIPSKNTGHMIKCLASPRTTYLSNVSLSRSLARNVLSFRISRMAAWNMVHHYSHRIYRHIMHAITFLSFLTLQMSFCFSAVTRLPAFLLSTMYLQSRQCLTRITLMQAFWCVSHVSSNLGS